MVVTVAGSMEASDLSGSLIVAMPGIVDQHFHHAVAYICAHNEHGAMGLVINRPTNVDLADVFEQMNIESAQAPAAGHSPVYAGGPVQQERGFVLHSPGKLSWNSSVRINDQVCITTSRDIMHAIAHGEGPDEVLVTMGYAGWSTGQLERELCENSWLCVPSSPQLLFSTPPERRWAASIETLGFNAGKLSVQFGQA